VDDWIHDKDGLTKAERLALASLSYDIENLRIIIDSITEELTELKNMYTELANALDDTNKHKEQLKATPLILKNHHTKLVKLETQVEIILRTKLFRNQGSSIVIDGNLEGNITTGDDNDIKTK